MSGQCVTTAINLQKHEVVVLTAFLQRAIDYGVLFEYGGLENMFIYDLHDKLKGQFTMQDKKHFNKLLEVDT